MDNNEEDRSQYEYHYNYQPVQPQSNPAPESGWTSPEVPRKKRVWPKVVAVVLCAALLLGGGFGAGWYLNREPASRDSGETQLTVSDRAPTDVETVKVTGGQKLSFQEIYAANVDSCVSIYVVSESSGYNLFGQRVMQASSGSGFVISTDGYIVTNYHVIEGGSTVQVTFNDGNTYDAQIVGGDADYDIAVLKIDTGDKELKSVVLGSSDSLVVGDEIMTIGNPLGELTFSLSDGRVSCLDREINVDGTPFNMIQISAPVNHGNSGGPLFNLYGEVVGIVSAKFGNTSSTDSVEGLGFAIPMNDVLDMIEDIIENGQVTSRAWLGIKGGDAAYFARQTGVSAGTYISEVTPDGPAEAAGLQVGDVITMIGTTQISSFADLQSAVGSKSYKAGDTTTITYVRDGQVNTTELTFGSTVDMPEDEESQQGQGQNGYPGQQPDMDGYGDMEDFFNQFFGGYGW